MNFTNNTVACTTRIKDITPDKINKKILHRLKNNDQTFTNLELYISNNNGNRHDEYFPKTAEEWAMLGYFVGTNTSLRKITVFGYYEERTKLPKHSGYLFSGLACNRSLKVFEFSYIDISDSKIFKLLDPFFKSDESLVDITLDSCSMDTEISNILSSSLRNCATKSLSFFGLRRCELSDESFAEILEALSLHTKLESLDMSDSHNTYGRNKYIKLASVMGSKFPGLENLYLDNSSIDDVSCVALSDAIANKRGLCTLDLSNNSIDNRGATSLAIALANSDMLQELILGHNRIGNEGVEALLQALGDKKDLQWLDLSTNEITSLGGFHLLTTNGTNFESLQTLILASNGINNEGMEHFMTALKDMKTLSSLDLTGNAITSINGQMLPSCLVKFFLRRNNIDDVGIITFVEALKSNTILRSLDLSENHRVSTDGWKSLSALFCSTISRLEYLFLSDNNIDDETAVSFSNALSKNCTLKYLDLYDNIITSVGWEALSNLLCNLSSVESTYLSNHTLTSLGYYFPPIGHDLLKKYLEMNEDENKKHVAIKKILHHHKDINMFPFFKWDLKMLPLMVKWLETAADIPMDFKANIDERKLSAIFQFVQNVSWLCTM